MFFAIPTGVEYRAQRYPVVTFTIMGLCTLLLKRGVVRSAAQEALEAEYRASAEPLVYLFDRGQQTGPFPVSQLTEMLRAGSISPEAVYWCDGMVDWKSVRDVAGGR